MQQDSTRTRLKRSYTINHSQEMLELALECMRKKTMSSYDAERHFGIPRRTLLDKLRRKHQKSIGAPTRLTAKEENDIVKVLIAAAEYGSPLNLLDLRIVVNNYLEKNGRLDVFKQKMPGEKWAYGFLKRHQHELSLRVTSNIKKARAEKSCDEMRQYFNNLKETMKEVPKQNVLNYDETNLSDDPGKSKCIVKRGTKYPERIMNHTKGCISIMFAGTADGKLLPPYVVYKSKQLWMQWVTGGPPLARYNHSKSGWFDASLFEDWFINIVVPWAKKLSGPKLVIGDNLASHLNPDVVALCEQHNIRFSLLPTNSTHLTQPLDVCVYAPLKRMWRKILTNFKMKNPAEKSLNKCEFPALLKQLVDELTEKKENITSAFATTGIYPLDPEKVLKRLPDYKPVSEYGVDKAVIDYLKEIRTPQNKANPVKNKKLKIEPGKSVSASDFAFTVNLDFKIKSKGKAKVKTNQNLKNNAENIKTVNITSDIVLSPSSQNQASTEEIAEPVRANVETSPKSLNPVLNKSYSDIDDYDEEMFSHKVSKKKVITPIKKKSQQGDDTDDEGDYSVHDSSSEIVEEEEDKEEEEMEIVEENEEEVSICAETEQEANTDNLKNPTEGGFILVKFDLEKGSKYYIGQNMQTEDENNFKVKFLRNKGRGRFAWPINDDISVVNKIDIEEVLPEPVTQRRGIITFNILKWEHLNIG